MSSKLHHTRPLTLANAACYTGNDPPYHTLARHTKHRTGTTSTGRLGGTGPPQPDVVEDGRALTSPLPSRQNGRAATARAPTATADGGTCLNQVPAVDDGVASQGANVAGTVKQRKAADAAVISDLEGEQPGPHKRMALVPIQQRAPGGCNTAAGAAACTLPSAAGKWTRGDAGIRAAAGAAIASSMAAGGQAAAAGDAAHAWSVLLGNMDSTRNISSRGVSYHNAAQHTAGRSMSSGHVDDSTMASAPTRLMRSRHSQHAASAGGSGSLKAGRAVINDIAGGEANLAGPLKQHMASNVVVICDSDDEQPDPYMHQRAAGAHGTATHTAASAQAHGAVQCMAAAMPVAADDMDVDTALDPDAAAASDEDDVWCLVCSSLGDEARMLLCDLCEGPYHMGCLPIPLVAIPEGDWFCPVCVKESNSGSRFAGDAEVHISVLRWLSVSTSAWA